MRDTLFGYFVEVGHSLCYMSAYATSARRIENLYSGFLMLASAAGIVKLAFWDSVPFLWVGIAAAAQILQVLKPLMPFSKQRDALKYTVQDIQALFDDVALYWDSVGAYDIPPEQSRHVAKEIREFKRRQQASENRFAADIDFPPKKRLMKKAAKENQKYFYSHYEVKVKELKK